MAFGWRSFVCAIAYGVLAWFSLQPEFLSLGLFYGLLSICLAATLVAFRGASEQPLTPLRLLLWAGCFHVIGVLGDPLWEDDFFRYLWDGYRFYETGSPYGIAPATFFGDGTIPTIFQGLLARINYPDVQTILWPYPAIHFSVESPFISRNSLGASIIVRFGRHGANPVVIAPGQYSLGVALRLVPIGH